MRAGTTVYTVDSIFLRVFALMAKDSDWRRSGGSAMGAMGMFLLASDCFWFCFFLG